MPLRNRPQRTLNICNQSKGKRRAWRESTRGKKGAKRENGGANVENGLMIGGNKLKGTLEFVDSFPLI